MALSRVVEQNAPELCNQDLLRIHLYATDASGNAFAERFPSSSVRPTGLGGAGGGSNITPTDSAFVERLFKTFDALDRKQDEYKTEVERTGDKREIFEIARKRDAEMRGMIDEVFSESICDSLFGGMNVYALAGGLPVWCNLLLAVMDEIDTSFATEQKATNPRLKKYLSKYHK